MYVDHGGDGSPRSPPFRVCTELPAKRAPSRQAAEVRRFVRKIRSRRGEISHAGGTDEVRSLSLGRCSAPALVQERDLGTWLRRRPDATAAGARVGRVGQVPHGHGVVRRVRGAAAGVCKCGTSRPTATVAQLHGHTAQVRGLHLQPTRRVLASSGFDKTIRLLGGRRGRRWRRRRRPGGALAGSWASATPAAPDHG